MPVHICMGMGSLGEDADPGSYYCLLCGKGNDREMHRLFFFECLCIISLMALNTCNIYNL